MGGVEELGCPYCRQSRWLVERIHAYGLRVCWWCEWCTVVVSRPVVIGPEQLDQGE